jgi:lycopene cyclase domain-containing protein
VASVTLRQRLVGVAAGGAVLLVGIACLRDAPTFYLGAILAWAGPVLALQWGFGWPVLWATRRTLALGVGVPTLYLWAADWVAIDVGVWVISETYTTGVTLFGLPVEEATFFLVTNLFVVQGLFLFLWVLDRWGWTAPAPTAPSAPGPASRSASGSRSGPGSTAASTVTPHAVAAPTDESSAPARGRFRRVRSVTRRRRRERQDRQ